VNSVEVPAYQAGMDARFRIAARHSRMVRVLRVAVPAAVLAAVAAIVLVSVFNPFRMLLPKLPIDMGNLVVSGTKITMESPHMAGFSADRRPYEVWAKTATQDVTDPDHVELKALRAKMLSQDDSTITLVARDGMMNTKDQLLDLHHDIYVQTSTGNEAWLSQATVDMNKGDVASDEHVDVKFSSGTVSSDRLRITGGGEVVRFEGNVVMHLDNLNTTPSDPAAAAAPAAAETEPAPQSTHAAKKRHSPAKTSQK
jgi:lipopolysaccharide export system protein LptC